MMDSRYENYCRQLTRRAWLGRAASGVGGAALGALLQQSSLLAGPAASRGIVDPLHFAPKAKRVIFLCQAGGMSHLETFDEKPKLAEMDGQPMPESFTDGQPIAQLQNKQLIASDHDMNSAPTAKRDTASLPSFRIWQRWPTNCASSSRRRPSRLITTRLIRS